MGAHLLTAEQVDALADFAFGCGDKVNMAALGQQAPELAAPRRVHRRPRPPRSCSRRCPPTSTSSAAHPLVQEKLMPVLGLVRARSVEHAHRRSPSWSPSTAGWATPRRSTPRDEAVVERVRRGGAHRPHPGQRADRGRRAGRRLQQPDPDVLARLRHLGRLQHDRERQLPPAAQHQDGLAPPYPAAVVPGARQHVLQRRRAGEPARRRLRDASSSSPTPTARPARRRRPGPQPAPHPARAGVQRGRARARRGAGPARRRRCSTGPGPTCSSPSAAGRCSTRPRRCGCSTSTRRSPSTS